MHFGEKRGPCSISPEFFGPGLCIHSFFFLFCGERKEGSFDTKLSWCVGWRNGKKGGARSPFIRRRRAPVMNGKFASYFKRDGVSPGGEGKEGRNLALKNGR